MFDTDAALHLLQAYEGKRRRDVEAGRRPPIRQRGLLPARNVACPCGSGKKWKMCCRRVNPYV